MSDEAESEKAYFLYLETKGVDLSKLVCLDDGTVPSKPVAGALRPEDLPLPRINVGAKGDFERKQVLGTGGMGQVVLATQRALERDIALKFLRPGHEANQTSELLREALVTGRLEHPNIVPVHLLALTAEGEPCFAMKRIEGTPWSALLKDPTAHPRLARDKADPLGVHLGVFLAVCDAVAFAHSKGILHRDLKPDNVMLGAFGEVYVVDWGIALSLKDDPHLPLARNVDTVAGTPSYMAPEMAAGHGPSFSERTDVYLLGAILHHVITGQPPHRGKSLSEVLTHAFHSTPFPYAASVPRELAAICLRAMAARPEERFANVEALGGAVADFLEHRDANQLATEATTRLSKLELSISLEKRGEGVDALEIHSTYSECRFGFEQALLLWADFEQARAGIERATRLMISHELFRENARAARALLAHLSASDAELEAAVTQLEERLVERTKRVATLERLEADSDLDVAATARGWALLGLGVAWGPASFGVGALVRAGTLPFGNLQALWTISIFAVTTGLLAEGVRRRVKLNGAQRRLFLGNWVALSSFVSFWLLSWFLQTPFSIALVQFMLLVAAIWGIGAALFDRRALRVAVSFAAGAALAAIFQRWQIEAFGVSTLTGFGLLGIAWRAGAGRRARSRKS